MEDNYPTKGMRPITGIVMYNFLYWLLKYHHQLESLQTLPAERLLSLARQFEEARPDLEPNTSRAWLNSFDKLFRESTTQDEYAAARKLIYR